MFPSPNTVAQKLLITQTLSQLKIKDCNLIKRVKNMFWELTDQFAIVESKLEFTFEWWVYFGPLYFGLPLLGTPLLHFPSTATSYISWFENFLKVQSKQ